MTLITSERHISGSKMSIYIWSSLQESTTHLLKNRHFPLRAPNPMLGHICIYICITYICIHIYIYCIYTQGDAHSHQGKGDKLCKVFCGAKVYGLERLCDFDVSL